MNLRKIFGVACIALLFLFPLSCARRAKAPQAGRAKAMDLIQLLPKNCFGIFAWDVRRTMDTSLARHSLEDKEVKTKIEEIKNQIGIDLTKDVFLIAGGIMSAEGKEQQPAAIINLRYNQDKILNFIKEKIPQALDEIVYEKKTIFKIASEKEPPTAFTFYNESNIFVGTIEGIEKIIDVCVGKAESIRMNDEFNSLLKKTKTESLSWSAFLLPPEAMAELAKSNVMLSSLEKLQSLAISFDYKNKNLVAEITARGSDETHHKQLAEFLSGMRSMGVMMANKYPEVVDVLNRLEITSTPQQVSLSFTLPEDLLIKLSDRMKKEVEANLPRLMERNF